MKPHVVIGGGIGGLIAAWSLRRRHPGAPVCLLEQAPQLGGLLASPTYPAAALTFDLGTHIFQETGEPAIDDFIREAIPPGQLVRLPAAAGDLAGVVFSGRLQAHSHFPDLRTHPQAAAHLAALRAHAASRDFSATLERGTPLVTAARRRFGARYADEILAPALAAMFQIPAAELAAFALQLPGLTRLVALDFPEWSRAVSDPALRALLGCPEQRDLPAALHHGRRSFTTRPAGSAGVISAVAERLTADGVSLRTGCTITALDPATLTLHCREAGAVTRTLEAETVFIATGVVGAARLLGVPTDDLHLAPPLLHRVVQLLLPRPAAGDLHYFQGLDPATSFYRVTHYRGFSGVPDDCRLSVEVLERAEITDAQLPGVVQRELAALGFIDGAEPRFARVERVPKGFPRPTTTNFAALAELRARVQPRLSPRLRVGGAGTGDGLFFTNEIITAIHREIQLDGGGPA